MTCKNLKLCIFLLFGMLDNSSLGNSRLLYSMQTHNRHSTVHNRYVFTNTIVGLNTRLVCYFHIYLHPGGLDCETLPVSTYTKFCTFYCTYYCILYSPVASLLSTLFLPVPTTLDYSDSTPML